MNVNEDYELRYWTAKFGCTTTELKAAVAAVGVMADKVETYLKKDRRDRSPSLPLKRGAPRVIAVLELHPRGLPARAIRRVDALGDDPLEVLCGDRADEYLDVLDELHPGSGREAPCVRRS